jgi:signal peptidase I
MPKQLVPPESYFVLGDNAEDSEDSRDYGVIKRQDIIGKRWL